MWKKKVIAYIKAKNKEDLLKMVSNYKKLDYMQWKDEEFERKEFFQTLDLEGIRWMMRITSGMVNTIRGNFKQKYRRIDQSITCQSCKEIRGKNEPDNNPIDTQIHVLDECEAYSDLRDEYDDKLIFG